MKKRVNPVGRLDIAAVRLLDEILKVKAPAIRAALFDGGVQEKRLRVGAAKLLGPRTRETRMIRDAAPLIGAALQDVRRVR